MHSFATEAYQLYYQLSRIINGFADVSTLYLFISLYSYSSQIATRLRRDPTVESGETFSTGLSRDGYGWRI